MTHEPNHAAGHPQHAPHGRHEKAYRRATVVLLALIGIIALVVLAAHIAVRALFGPFYADAEDQFAQPGLDAGFVPQDLAYAEDGDRWLFSGYQKDGGPSPVYVRTQDGSVLKINVETPDGTAYDGHGSGISQNKGRTFLTQDGGYLVFDSADFATAQNGDTIRAKDQVDLDFTPSFLNVVDGDLYVGEFFLKDAYDTHESHHLMTPDGTRNAALMFVYPAGDGPNGFQEKAAHVFSIPEKVQGVTITDGGNLVLSTSYGLNPSYLQVFDADRVIQDGEFVADGRAVPLYCLDSRNLQGQLVVPPMSEGIATHEGSVYVSEESASGKYLFGRLYGAGYVFSVPSSTLDALDGTK